MNETQFFIDIGILFLAALGGALVAQLLRQPLIVGYVLAGIAVGPFTPGPTIANAHAFEQLAEIGVILMMFSIGMEFSFSALFAVGRVALIGGPVGIVLLTLLTVGIGALLGWNTTQSIVVGAALSVASTMVLTKFLLERGDLSSAHGQAVVGITLVEDLAVVVMTLLLPALTSASGGDPYSLLRGLVLAAVMLLPIAWLGRRIVPSLLARMERTESEELLLLATITIATATAAFTVYLGLSHALGAFLAGLAISESEPAHRALDRILPMRDILVAMFFVSIGMLIRPSSLVAEFPTVAAMVLVVTGGKLAVWTAIMRIAGYSAGTALLAGLSLTQIGEFSYIIGKVGWHHGLVTREAYDAILGTSLVTIVLNALAFRRQPRHSRA